MSINEKRIYIWDLAYKIAYKNDKGELRKLSSNESDFIHVILDFGYDYVDRILEGRTSLQEQIDFDSEEFEKKLDNDIIKIKEIAKKYSIKIKR